MTKQEILNEISRLKKLLEEKQPENASDAKTFIATKYGTSAKAINGLGTFCKTTFVSMYKDEYESEINNIFSDRCKNCTGKYCKESNYGNTHFRRCQSSVNGAAADKIVCNHSEEYMSLLDTLVSSVPEEYMKHIKKEINNHD